MESSRELLKEEYIVSTFKNRIHYSLEDFECNSNCPQGCTDAMARYRIYEGQGLSDKGLSPFEQPEIRVKALA